MALSIPKLLQALRAIESERRVVLRRLMRSEELAVGTVGWVERKCGRPRCHCASGPGHRQMQFLFGDAQGRRCKLIRKADVARLGRAGRRYRDFRDGVRKLEAISKEERTILMALMQTRRLDYQ